MILRTPDRLNRQCVRLEITDTASGATQQHLTAPHATSPTKFASAAGGLRHVQARLPGTQHVLSLDREIAT
jgi:hypothetical protein